MTHNDSLPFKKESDFTKAALKWLNSQPSTWAVKYHSSAYTTYGVPDILCSVNGTFLALELKAEGGMASPLQLQVISKIRLTGSLAFVAWRMVEIKSMWMEAKDGLRR